MNRNLAAALAAALLLAAPASGRAQTAPDAYRPGLGDLMTMTVQPRHIKLMLAARESNWAYAAYELHELQEAFERSARAWPAWQRMPMAEMFDAIAKGPMAEIAQVIKDKDAAKFARAYDQLTEGCNACHQAARRGFVVIKTPDGSPFPDQDFRPVPR